MAETSSGFYFALPRLFTRTYRRSEKNALETTSVGVAVQLVAYLFTFELLIGDATVITKLLLSIPIAFLVWIFWLIFFYASNLILRPFRPQRMARAQSFNLGCLTTGFALYVLLHPGWPRFIAMIWLAAVALNLLATAILALRSAND